MAAMMTKMAFRSQRMNRKTNPPTCLLGFGKLLKSRIVAERIPDGVGAEKGGGDAIVARFSQKLAEDCDRFVGLAELGAGNRDVQFERRAFESVLRDPVL